MDWTAVIPFKGRRERKTRLACFLSPQSRTLLAEQMFLHVAATLRAHPRTGCVVVLSDLRPAGWDGTLVHDRGEGLNNELEALATARAGSPMLIIHADLPLLAAADVSAMLDAGERGCAIAPDRHLTGTNAIALLNSNPFRFSFDAGSFPRHLAEAGKSAIAVNRTGTALDIDTIEDLSLARSLGFVPAFDAERRG